MRRGGSSWGKDPQQLGTAVGLKRGPRPAGETGRVGRPRPPAAVAHHPPRRPPLGDLPAPAARTGTRTNVLAQVRTDLPAHQCETATTHATPGEPGRTTPARRHAGSPQIGSQSVTQPGRRRAQVAVLAQRGGCDLGNVGLTDVGDLRGRQAGRSCAAVRAGRTLAGAPRAPFEVPLMLPLHASIRMGTDLPSRVRLWPPASAWPGPSAETGRTVPPGGS